MEVLQVNNWLKQIAVYDGYDPINNKFINPHYNNLKGGYGGNYTKEFLMFLHKIK